MKISHKLILENLFEADSLSMSRIKAGAKELEKSKKKVNLKNFLPILYTDLTSLKRKNFKAGDSMIKRLEDDILNLANLMNKLGIKEPKNLRAKT